MPPTNTLQKAKELVNKYQKLSEEKEAYRKYSRKIEIKSISG
ncbi:MAG: hypothetical protein ABH814_00215 [bacterium]